MAKHTNHGELVMKGCGRGRIWCHGFRGFTLIELLVVLAIMGTLLSIAAPRYAGSMDKANLAVLEQNLDAMRVSIDKMHGDGGKYPQTLEELVSKRYLRRVPVDPITGSRDSWILVPSTDPDDPGIVDVKSAAPGAARNGKLFSEL